MRVCVDLHNHSCLSPCASLDMAPSQMARLAKERGLGILGLSDHNTALNATAFAVACGREGVAPLFGIEANSIEEVHVLCIFATPEEALDFGAYLYAHLPDLPWDPAVLGDQAMVDADDNVLDLPERYFGAALDVSFDVLCAEAARRGGLVIPAHVDRPRYSVGSQLGFLPKGPYDAVESVYEPSRALSRGLAALSGSDAHALEQIARRPFSVELPESIVAQAVAAAQRYAAECAACHSACAAASSATSYPAAVPPYTALAAPYPAAAAHALLEALRAAFAAQSAQNAQSTQTAQGKAIVPTYPPRRI